MEQLTIGQVAERLGIGVETVRFFERRGLIDEPPRAESGYRLYGAGDVERLRFIRRAKDLGFKLSEIAELLQLRGDLGAVGEDMRGQVQFKLADIEAKIRDLEGMRETLLRLTRACSGGSLEACPIMGALTKGETP